jgi:hypothetical protein
MVGLWWILAGGMCLSAAAEADSKSVKLVQSTTVEIGGRTVGLVKILSRVHTVTGEPYFLADLAVADRGSKKEQSYLVAEGNEIEIGNQKVKIGQIRPASSRTERGFVVLQLEP